MKLISVLLSAGTNTRLHDVRSFVSPDTQNCLFNYCDDPNNVALSAGHIEETSPVAMRNVTR